MTKNGGFQLAVPDIFLTPENSDISLCFAHFYIDK
jgi:hypothetical protein